jgi:hypothetical protein
MAAFAERAGVGGIAAANESPKSAYAGRNGGVGYGRHRFGLAYGGDFQCRNRPVRLALLILRTGEGRPPFVIGKQALLDLPAGERGDGKQGRQRQPPAIALQQTAAARRGQRPPASAAEEVDRPRAHRIKPVSCKFGIVARPPRRVAQRLERLADLGRAGGGEGRPVHIRMVAADQQEVARPDLLLARVR